MSVLGAIFGGGASKTPTYVPPTAPVVPTPATTADQSVQGSGASTRSAAAAAAGLQSTIKTSSQGAASTAVGTKSLLGQ